MRDPPFLVGGCNFDGGGYCDWTQSSGDDLQFFLDSADIFNNYQTGPPSEHTSPGLVPDKDCKKWGQGK